MDVKKLSLDREVQTYFDSLSVHIFVLFCSVITWHILRSFDLIW